MMPGRGVICLGATTSKSGRNYVYIWTDGVYLQARMEENAECMLVIIGATPVGDHRRDAGGKEGIDRLSGRPSGKCAELA